MQDMKDVHSLRGLCEPGGTGAEREAGRRSSPAAAETDSRRAENLGPEASRSQVVGTPMQDESDKQAERRWKLLFPCIFLPQLAPKRGEGR